MDEQEFVHASIIVHFKRVIYFLKLSKVFNVLSSIDIMNQHQKKKMLSNNSLCIVSKERYFPTLHHSFYSRQISVTLIILLIDLSTLTQPHGDFRSLAAVRCC